MSPHDGTLDRRAVAAALLRDPGDLLVVTGLGAPSYDAAAAGDRPLNFYLWGAMGGAAMVGLGLALAQPRRRVLVLTGDGEMLMGMGSLATIAAAVPPNLAIAVLDNARYGETGSQRSHTGLGTDLAAVAAACGWPPTATATRHGRGGGAARAAAAGAPVRRDPHCAGRIAAAPAPTRRRLAHQSLPAGTRDRQFITCPSCFIVFQPIEPGTCCAIFTLAVRAKFADNARLGGSVARNDGLCHAGVLGWSKTLAKGARRRRATVASA